MISKQIVTTCAILFTLSTYSVEIKVSFWEKEICQGHCLPTALGNSINLQLTEPLVGEISSLQHTGENSDYHAKLTWIKREEFGGYSSFQTEIFYQGRLIGLCSRYEALDSLENAPVGACAAKIPNKNKLLGFTIALP